MRTRGIILIAILFFTNLFSLITYSQDTIFKINGEEIIAKVIKITPELVEYYKFNRTEGPLYSIYITDVSMIKYPEGSQDKFSVAEKNNQEVNEGESKVRKEVDNDKFIDERDGNEYKIVKIGDQWWMAENLKYQTENSSCFKIDSNKCEECGQFYQFEDALNVCPTGWHLPTDDEWINLEVAVGMYNIDARKIGWRGTKPGQAPLLLEGGSSGLDLLFCGYVRRKTNSYYDSEAYYWTATASNINKSYVWSRHFKLRKSIERVTHPKSNKFSVRCIKDTE